MDHGCPGPAGSLWKGRFSRSLSPGLSNASVWVRACSCVCLTQTPQEGRVSQSLKLWPQKEQSTPGWKPTPWGGRTGGHMDKGLRKRRPGRRGQQMQSGHGLTPILCISPCKGPGVHWYPTYDLQVEHDLCGTAYSVSAPRSALSFGVLNSWWPHSKRSCKTTAIAKAPPQTAL